MEKRNIIIDCDPGHDDMIAILLALANKEKMNLLAITTVAGNQTIEKVTQNALNILSFINEDIPVAKGQKKAIMRPYEIGDGKEIHGESGLGGYELPISKNNVVSENAVKYLYDIIMNCDEKITLIATGPLTNIGTLLLTYPEIEEKIDMISIMGGSVYAGNITPHAEYNIYADPEAAKIVFDSNIPKILSPLEVTHKSFISYNEITDLCKEKGKMSYAVGRLFEFHGAFYKKLGLQGAPIHDACAVMYLLYPDYFESRKYFVDVETIGKLTDGMTVMDTREWADDSNANTLVLLDIDRDKFIEKIISAIKFFD